MAMKLWVGLLVLLEVLRAAANVQTTYYEIGQSLVLKPKFSETITSITWKYRGDIVAEWIKNELPLEYLGDLKDRTELDLITGTLTARNMNKSDDGPFTVEINNRVLPDTFNAVGVNRLDGFTLEIHVQPLACASKGFCTLVCDGTFQDAGPIQYFWKFGETGQWKKVGYENKANVSEADSKEIKSFSCKAKNPVSEKVSDPYANPFITESENANIGLLAGIFVTIIVVGAIITALIYLYKKPNTGPKWIQNILNHFRKTGAGSDGQTANGEKTEPTDPKTPLQTQNEPGQDQTANGETTEPTDPKTPLNTKSEPGQED